MGLREQLIRRRQRLQAELAEVEAAIGAIEGAQPELTESYQSGNTTGNMTATASLARAKHASEGAVKPKSKVGEFVAIIGKPHAGGPGYTMRSLAQALREENRHYRVSHVTLSLALRHDSLPPEKRRPINPVIAKRIKELTGYPLSSWPAIAASK